MVEGHLSCLYVINAACMIMNELLSTFTGNTFPRSMGRPWRSNTFGEYYIVNSVEEIEENIANWNETDCFISVYPYTEYTQTNRNKMSAVVNVLAFDFDSEDNLAEALADVKILLKWSARHNITPRITYTGNRGFHVYIDIEPIELQHKQETLRKFFVEINKAAGFTSLDLSIAGDLERIIRLPNTKHSKSGLYCIPINPKILPILTVSEICTLAKKKSNYIPVRNENSVEIRALLEEYDIIVGQEMEEMKIKIKELAEEEKNSLFPGLRTGVPCMAYKYYIEAGAEKGTRDYILTGCIHKLKGDGFTKDKIFRILQEFGKKCNPPIEDSYIKTRLDTHFLKSYSLCTFFSKVSSICDACPNRKF